MIFEINYQGHRLQYVKALIQGLLPLSNNVVLVTSQEAAQSKEFQTHLSALTPCINLEIRHYPNYENPLRQALIKLQAFRSALKDLSPEHVYIPYADGLAQVLGATKWAVTSTASTTQEIEGILMRGRFAYPADHWYDHPWAATWRTATSLAPFSILHQLDPIPFAVLKKQGGSLGARSRLIPEPVQPIKVRETVEARRRLGLPLSGRYIASLGNLDARKGIHLLLQAFAQAKLASNDRLLLIGKPSPEIRTLINTQMGPLVRDERLILIDDYVSDETFNFGMCAADVICTPYPRHIGSSGIVVRAVATGKPILASDYGWVGAVVSAFKLGTTVPVHDLGTFAEQIVKSLDNAESFRLTEGGRRFGAFHTIQNFSTHITARIQMRLGQGEPNHKMQWSQVMAAADNKNTVLEY